MPKDTAAGADTKELPEIFAHYRIVRPLGKGGMGTVYLAQDTRLNRQVALKVCHLADSPHALARFRREAQAAASLRHPGLCPVYDYDVHDGIPYFTMALIDGPSLDKWIAKRGGLTPREAAGLTRKLAIALQAAHAKGVIHRDLKPSNVALENGEPVVLDFGLARHSEVNTAESRLTKAGSILGTPTYMSPEQVEGNVEAMGPATDIYSLGIMLYEFLTGQAPFEGSVAAVLGHIMATTPKPPSEVRPGLDAGLEAICLKAIAKKPTDRWPSMEALAAALMEWGRTAPPDAGTSPAVPVRPGAPNSTLKTGAGQAARGTVHPTLKTGAAQPPATPTVTFERGKERAEETAGPGTKSGESARTTKNAAGETAAEARQTAVKKAAQTRVADKPEPQSQHDDEDAPAARSPAKKKKKNKVNKNLENTVYLVRYGSGFIALLILLVVFYQIMKKRDWSLSGGTVVVKENEETGDAKKPNFTPPSDFGSQPAPKQGPTIPVMPIQPGTGIPVATNPPSPPIPQVGELRSFNQGAPVIGVVFPEEGAAFLAVTASGMERCNPEANLAFGPQGKIMVTVGISAMQLNAKENEVFLLTGGGGISSYQTSGVLFPKKGGFAGLNTPRAMVVAEDGLWLAVGSELGCLDLANLRAIGQFSAPGVRCLAAVPNVRRVVSGNDQGIVQVWDTAAKKLQKTFDKGHTGRIRAVGVSTDGQQVVSAGEDKSVRIWDAQTGKESRRCDGHGGPVTCLALFRNAPFALSGSEDGTVRLWDLDEGRELWKFEGHKGIVHAVAVAPNNLRGVSGGADQTARLFAWPENLVKSKLKP